MVSVVIPSRNERFLRQTCEEVMDKAKQEVEVMFLLDDGSVGMRDAINTLVEHARGKYIMKLDAHCALSGGFDVALKAHHKPNWVQIPQRKRLDAHKWIVDHENPVNYMYMNKDFVGIKNRTQESDTPIHPTETFQGSCYFMERDYYLKLGLLDSDKMGPFAHEAQEICIKVASDGGKIMRNEHAWYAHSRLGRRYVADYTNADNNIKNLAREYGYKRRA